MLRKITEQLEDKNKKPEDRVGFVFISSFILLISIFCLLSSPVHAAPGIYRTINFQGKVVNKAGGTNITNGSYSFVFKLYDDPTAGNQLPTGTPWSETQSLTVTDGIFRATLGSSTVFPAGLDFNSDLLYLDITFNGETFGSRVRLTAVPYAFNAEKVSGLTVTSTTGTLTIPNATTVTFSGANNLTFTTTNITNATLPTGTITLADTASNQSFTNKTIGSTGLTFSGATTDITTVSNEDFTIMPNGTGKVGIGTTAPAYSLDIASTLPATGTGIGASIFVTDSTTGTLSSVSREGLQVVYSKTGSGTLSSWSSAAIGALSALYDGTTVDHSGVWSRQSISGGTATSLTDFWADSQYGTTGSVGSKYGLKISDFNKAVGQTLTNQYGVYINALTSATTDNFAVYTAGTTKSYFGGNVGIGTNNPTTRLSIGLDNYSDTQNIAFKQFSSNNRAAFMEYVGNGDFTGALKFGVNSITSDSDATEAMRISNTGRVSIGGVLLPDSLLQVSAGLSGENQLLTLTNTTGGLNDGSRITFNSATGLGGVRSSEIASIRTSAGYESNLTFRTNSGASGTSVNDVMTLLGSGNVGIGVTAPTQKLDVLGSATASGNITMGGQLQVGRFGSDTPTLGNGSIVYNTTTNKFRCYQAGAWTDCIGAGTGSSVWSDLTAPTAALSMNMYQSVGTSFATTFTYGNATSTTNLFNITDTASNTGTGYMANFSTATGSTLKPFHVSAAGTEALLVNASGNVGIGTTDPRQRLDVNGNVALAWNDGARIGVEYLDGSNYRNGMSFNITDRSTYIDALASASEGEIIFRTGTVGVPSEKMRIQPDGSVGIGTATPTHKLDVASITSTADLANFDWSPATSTTSTADFFALNIGANGIIGNIFNIKDNGGSVLGISQSAITANLPANFTAAGDVGIAYDINFSNPTSSFLKSVAPLYVVSGEVFNSSDLTLRTYNYGNVIVDSHLYLSNPTATGKALSIFNQLENQDIFTASASGVSKFTVDRFGSATASANITMGGQLQLGRFGSAPPTVGLGSLYYDTGTNKVYYFNNTAWTEMGAGTSSSSGPSVFQELAGFIRPLNNTADILFGGSATSSAKFAFLNLNSGAPMMRLDSDSTDTNKGCFRYNGGTNQMEYSNDCVSFQTFASSTGGGWTDDGTTMRLTTSTDNVGIGNAAATYSLDVVGTNGVRFTNAAGKQFLVTMNAATAPTVDLMNIANSGASQGAATTAVDGLQIDFANTGAGSQDNAGLRISVNSGNSNAASTIEGLMIDNLVQTGSGANAEESAIKIGTTWDNEIYFANNAANIKLGSDTAAGSSINFKDANNTTVGAFKEYFANSGYGAFEANGFINIDGSYFQDQFLRQAAQGTADVVAPTARYGDNLRWVFNEMGTSTNSTNAAYAGCIVNQNKTISVNDTRGSTVNGVLELQPDTAVSTTGSYGGGCAVSMANGTSATNTVALLHAANKFVMYFKVKPSALWTNTVSLHPFWMGAANYTQPFFGGITYSGTYGGIFLGNSTATNTSGGGRADWVGISRNGTNNASVSCSQNVSTAGYALGRIEARGTSDIRFFMDADVSNGIALSECGSGINGTNTAAIPGVGAGTNSNMYLEPFINVGFPGGTDVRSTNHIYTMYIDFVAFVQDDPRDPPTISGLSPLISDSAAVSETVIPKPDPIAGADVAENYAVKGDYLQGDIMVADKLNPGGVERTGQSYDRKLLGVVSESPGLVLGQGGSLNSVPIALSGRVPVRVNGAGGVIHVGDPITSSEVPGVGMRAVQPGKIIGTALEEYSGTEEKKILVHVNVGYYLGDEGDTALIEQKKETTLVADQGNNSATDSADINLVGLSATASGTLNTEETVVQKITTFVQNVKVSGMFEAAGQSIFKGTSQFLSAVKFEQFVDFINEVVFRKAVTFEETVAFNKDMAGYAKIKKGSRFVDVTFEREFPSEPVVSANVVMSNMTDEQLRENITSGICKADDTLKTCEEKTVQDLFDTNVKYTITAKTKQGFMIILEEPLLTDISFSWTALVIKDVKTYESKPEVAGEATSSAQLDYATPSAVLTPPLLPTYVATPGATIE